MTNKEKTDDIFVQGEKMNKGRSYPSTSGNEEPDLTSNATEIVVSPAVEISYDDIATGEEKQSIPRTPDMVDMLLHEVKRLATISNVYNQCIDDSKTKPKRDLYAKKLKKNNKKLADMLIRLEQLTQIKKNKEATDE